MKNRDPGGRPANDLRIDTVAVTAAGGRVTLPGTLRLPGKARALLVFAHGSGSSRFSPRNVAVAEALGRCGFATLLFDLLTEDEARDRRNVFDILLLAERVGDAISWSEGVVEVSGLPIGLFGASTGAGAALAAAAARPDRVGAVVSRGGRPDLAAEALPHVRAPTLLIVGGRDVEVLRLNEAAWQRIDCPAEIAVIEGATHLFDEPGALDEVTQLAAAWFSEHLSPTVALGR